MQKLLPKITFISVGKVKPEWQKAVSDYQARLGRACDFKSTIIKEVGSGENDTRGKTSAKILEHVAQSDFLLLCDERGKDLSSLDLADKLESIHKNTVVVVGSSYGASESLRLRANLVMSLSPFVLPHEIARVLVLEQLYRSHCILNNHPYHHA